MISEKVQFAALVVASYAVYMTCHLLAGQPIPNGVLLSGIVGAVCVLAGVQYGLNKARNYIPPEDCTEQ